MSDRDAMARIRPRKRRDRNQLLMILGYLGIGIGGAAALSYLVHRSHVYREQNWYSAPAKIEDVRPVLVHLGGSHYGGVALYQVQVLAVFWIDGHPTERGITVEQRLKPRDIAEDGARMWKGHEYIVRWNPLNPEQISVDLPLPL